MKISSTNSRNIISFNISNWRARLAFQFIRREGLYILRSVNESNKSQTNKKKTTLKLAKCVIDVSDWNVNTALPEVIFCRWNSNDDWNIDFDSMVGDSIDLNL